ncbi:MAG TPA: acylphosphatase [Thermoanaerobaculia bacterium]|nr:acylphosphatase [Thermoanaerobaculia bacterium]
MSRGGGGAGDAGGGGGGLGDRQGRGERVALRLRLRGRVQGVGFRWFVRGVARELGLAGRVRNLRDGSVEIEVAGDPKSVEELKARVRQGPPGAAVAGLHEERLAAEPDWDGFQIDH